MVQMIVLPWSDNTLIDSTIDLAMKLSRPLVGSSQNRIEGFVIIFNWALQRNIIELSKEVKRKIDR
jgi:hypothetical protein